MFPVLRHATLNQDSTTALDSQVKQSTVDICGAMENAKVATTYGKRAPLSDLSTNIPVSVRQSKRVNFAQGLENPATNNLIATSSSYEDECKSLNVKVEVSVNEMAALNNVPIMIGEPMVESSGKTQSGLKIEDSAPKRSQRIPTPRVPLNIPRQKKKMTLAAHIRKYAATHIIECEA